MGVRVGDLKCPTLLSLGRLHRKPTAHPPPSLGASQSYIDETKRPYALITQEILRVLGSQGQKQKKGQLDIYYKSQYHPSSVGPSLTTLFKITDLYRGLPNTSPSFFTLLYLGPFDVLYNYYFIDI